MKRPAEPRTRNIKFYRRDDVRSEPMDELEKEDRDLLVGMKVWVWYESVRGGTRRIAHLIEVDEDAVRVRYNGLGRVTGFDEYAKEERIPRFGKDGWSLAFHVRIHEKQPMKVSRELLRRQYGGRP
jgi:hypothetical protein